MRYRRLDTKVAVVLRDDLLPWQELNVTAFLTSGIATSAADLTGEPYRDKEVWGEIRAKVRQTLERQRLQARAYKAAADRNLGQRNRSHGLFVAGDDDDDASTFRGASSSPSSADNGHDTTVAGRRHQVEKGSRRKRARV